MGRDNRCSSPTCSQLFGAGDQKGGCWDTDSGEMTSHRKQGLRGVPEQPAAKTGKAQQRRGLDLGGRSTRTTKTVSMQTEQLACSVA